MDECGPLYEQCKDLKQRILNEEYNVQQLQAFVDQNAAQRLNGMSLSPKVQEASAKCAERRQIMTNMMKMLAENTGKLINALLAGEEQMLNSQNELNAQLDEFKYYQKRAQNGAPFPDLSNRDTQLHKRQERFETLATQSYNLRNFAKWMMELLKYGAQHDDQEQAYVAKLDEILTNLEQMFVSLVLRSFIVTVQPDAVHKIGHKIGTELRFLVEDKLGIKPQLDQASCTVKIIEEETAKQLMADPASIARVKEVGKISIPVEKFDQNKRIVSFKNSKLTNIEKRKQTSKAGPETGDEKAAAARKYALLFQISSLDIGTRCGKIDIWTLSNPLMVTVHTSQVCLAHAAISWHLEFGPVYWSNANVELMTVNVNQMGELLKHKFSHFTGARRSLNDSDVNYLLEKMLGKGWQHTQPIAYHQYAVHYLPEGNFSFWKWFFAAMELIKGKLIDFWNEGYLIGFIGKGDATKIIMESDQPTCIMRFSDSIPGSVSIGFQSENSENNEKDALHLQPFTVKDLEELSLAQRIGACPQLEHISHVYPDIVKADMLDCIDKLERKRQSKNPKKVPDDPVAKRYYVKAKLAMIVERHAIQHNRPQAAAQQPSPASVVSTSQTFSVESSPANTSAIYGSDRSNSNSLTSPSDQSWTNSNYTATDASIETDVEFAEEDLDLDAILMDMDPEMAMELYDIDDVLEVIANQDREAHQEYSSFMYPTHH